MNVAAIAMSVNLFNDKPTQIPTNSIQKHASIDDLPEIYAGELEDSLLPPPSMKPSTVLDHEVSNEEDEPPKDFNTDNLDGDDESDNMVNGTGLILYATPTAAKAPYWKRRLGWKPSMARVQRNKFKNLFRVPVRRHATVGFSDAHKGDALLMVSNNKANELQSTGSSEEVQQPPREQRQCEPEKEYVIVDDDDVQVKGKGWNAFHAVNHDLIFA